MFKISIQYIEVRLCLYLVRLYCSESYIIVLMLFVQSVCPPNRHSDSKKWDGIKTNIYSSSFVFTGKHFAFPWYILFACKAFVFELTWGGGRKKDICLICKFFWKKHKHFVRESKYFLSKCKVSWVNVVLVPENFCKRMQTFFWGVCNTFAR